MAGTGTHCVVDSGGWSSNVQQCESKDKLSKQQMTIHRRTNLT